MIKPTNILKNYEVSLLILIAFTFSVAVRMVWVFFFADTSDFFWNGQLMINTNDGYYYAEGARDILSGVHQVGDSSPIDGWGSILTAFFAYILPFSFESVILYLPAFLSSLIVIPIILIGKSLGQLKAGFIAALLASIAWSYYNRTMIGYFDTDMLNIVFPSLLLWTLVLAFKTKQEHYLLFMALDIIAYRLWYPQSYALEFSFFGLILFYILFFDRKNHFLIKLITMMLLAMMGLPTWARVFLVVASYIVFKRKDLEKYLYYFLVAAIGLFFLSGGLDPIWGKLKVFVFRDALLSVGEGMKFNFMDVSQTISEAKAIPFEIFADRISGSMASFFIAIIGYVLLAIRHKVMLLALPLIGLGFLAYGIPGVISAGGLRFTIYAVVPLALGLAYLIVLVSELISKEMKDEKTQHIVSYLLISLATIAILYPNVKHVFDYKVPTVMTQKEVEVLDTLKKVATPEDYTVAWWDYGYPIRYYSDVKTLCDGSGHDGQTNYPVALALTSPQSVAAKVARMAVERRERNYKNDTSSWYKIPDLIKENEFYSSQDYLDVLGSFPIETNTTRDIFFFLPYRMTSIYGVVDSFASVDVFTGQKSRPSMLQMYPIRDMGDRFELVPGLYFSKQDYKLHQGDKTIPIQAFYNVQYDQQGQLHKARKVVDVQSRLSVVLLPSYGQIMLLDEKAFNSTYVQLFFFDNYDQRYFEPVVLTPSAKVYKLKI